jgi:uncharacterized protein (DUF2141 family)
MNPHLSCISLIAAGSLLFGPSAQAAELTVTVTDIRSDKGHLLVSVSNTDAAWDNKEKPVAGNKIAVSGKEAVLRFNLPAGSYAVQVLHDENDNGTLDSNFMGIPTEGYGFSNNPRVLRKAYFSEAKFDVADDAKSIVINLR